VVTQNDTDEIKNNQYDVMNKKATNLLLQRINVSQKANSPLYGSQDSQLLAY
jgi:hypothetical protein